MKKQTAEKVANLLASVAHTIAQNGRPRKNPGCWRPDAVSWSGEAVRPTHKDAVQWSLWGALVADAEALGYSRYVINQAADMILGAVSEQDFEQLSWYTLRDGIVQLDDLYYDTRAIVRYVRKARRNVEREQLAA